MPDERIKITCRLPLEDVEFLDAEVVRNGKGTNRTEQLHLAITGRRIALMPKWKRDKLAERLGVRENGEVPDNVAGDDDGRDRAGAEGIGAG